MLEKQVNSNKKQALLIVRWPISGIRNYLRYVYNSSEFRDYHFTIVAPDIDFSRYFERDLNSSKFTYVASENSTSSLAWTVAKLLLKNKFDLVNPHGFSSAIASLPFAKLKLTPTLLTVHDVFTAAQFNIKHVELKRWLLTRVFSSASEIMTVSEDCRENLIEYLPKVDQKGLFANLNGINSDYFFNANTANFDELYPETIGKYRIGFLGRFMSQKGFYYIIEAIEYIKQNHPELSPQVICFGDGGFIREDSALIEKKGLTSYFHFLPYTDDVAAAIKGLDLVLMPSLWEACGLLAMEVLCAGTPLIATNCVGLREVLKETPAKLVEPKNSRAIADAIIEKAQVDSKQSFQEYAPTAKERYDVSKHVEKLLASYQRIVKG